MRTKYILPTLINSSLCLVFYWTALEAQILVQQNLPGVANGRAAWADYDDDGDLDLVLIGEAINNGQCFPIARVFHNENGALVEGNDQTAQLVGTFYGDVAWADYDSDGDLDLLIAGMDAADTESLRLYANEPDGETARVLRSVDVPDFIGLRYAAVAWADYDSDGDLDLLATGMDTQGKSRTILYRNTDGVFIVDGVNKDLIVLHNGAVAWVDYDGDGDLDLSLAGENIAAFGSGAGPITELYRNDPTGTLSVEQETAEVVQVKGGGLAWADYNGDGTPDLAVSGRDVAWNASTALYLNQPTGTFKPDERFASIVQNSVAGPLAWIDYDGDGDPDLTTAGRSARSTYHTAVWANHNGTFTDSAQVFPGLAGGDVAWADYDGDGRIELLVLGLDETGQSHTRLYRDLGPPNQAPAPPAQPLFAQASGDGVRFNWNPGTDAESHTLTYNLRLGTEPGSNDILSGTTSLGPGSLGTHFLLRRDLQHDFVYYWSVQSVDGAQARSPWSPDERLIVQQIVSSQQRLDGLMESAMDWADYDGDGDPDLVIMGKNRNSQAQTSLYENHDGLLQERPDADLFALRRGAVAWGDFDGDGDPDLAHSGLDTGEQGFGFLYKNETGRFTVHQDLSEVVRSSSVKSAGADSDLDWGDYDNDGDLDLAYIGADNLGSSHTWILRNLGPDGFAVAQHRVEVGFAEINGFSNGKARWADYDNDGDLDLALTGGNRSGIWLQLLRNDAAELVESGQRLEGVETGGLAWGDYDGDGDLDLVAGGISELVGPTLSTTLYRNDSGQLVATQIALPGIQEGDLVWGDYDNDNDLDLVIVGNNTDLSFLSVYENQAGNFVPDPIIGLEGLDLAAVSLTDYDNDGDLDLISSGRAFPSSEPRTQININLTAQTNANQPPQTPFLPADALLDSADTVLFRWLPAADDGDKTPQSITYDLRVGTGPDTWDIMPEPGSLGQGALGTNTFGRLVDLVSGTYYWSVRAVDDGFARSPWTAPFPFTIDTVRPVLVGIGMDTAEEFNGFVLNTDRVGIGQSLILNLVFFDLHSGVNHEILPIVTADIEGQVVPFETLQFTGENWSGQLIIESSMPTGVGSISVAGLVDNSGKSMVPFDSLAAFFADTQAPGVVRRFPEVGATDVIETLEAVTIVFSAPLDPTTLTEENFQLRGDGTPLPLRVESAAAGQDSTVRLVLQETLLPGTQYTVEISAAIQDLVGNRPNSALLWTFSTRFPSVVSTVPPDGADVKPEDKRLAVVFSSPVNPALIVPVNFRFTRDGRLLALDKDEFLYDEKTFTVRFPRIGLISGSLYEAVVLPSINGPLGLDRPEWRWSFTTDISQVVSTVPKDGTAGVSTRFTLFQINLSAPAASQDSSAIQLRVRPLDDLQALLERVPLTSFGADENNTRLRFSPTEPLKPFSLYEVVVRPQILGPRATVGHSWTFSTADRLDASQGGRVSDAKGDVTLYFPPKALGFDVAEVSIQPLGIITDLHDGAVRQGIAYVIGTTSLNNSLNRLNKKATLTIRYPTDQTESQDIERLAIFRQDNDQQWQRLGGTVNPDSAQISVAVDSLGTFAVFAADPPEEKGPTVADLSCQPRMLSPKGGGFAAQTEISFTLGKAAATSVKVFDPEGHLVRRLMDGEALLSGANVCAWDGRNQDGQFVYDGPYVVLVEAGGASAKKIVVVVNGQR